MTANSLRPGAQPLCFYRTFVDFSFPGQTEATLVLETPPAGAVLQSVQMEILEAFFGPAVSALTLSMGVIDDDDLILPISALTVSSKFSHFLGSYVFDGSTDLTVNIISTGADLDVLTAGKVTFRADLLYRDGAQAPASNELPLRTRGRPIDTAGGAIDTAGGAISTGSGTVQGGQNAVLTPGVGPVTLLPEDSGQIFSNDDVAGGVLVFILPPANFGLEYTFMCSFATGIQIAATASANIYMGGNVTVADGNILSTEEVSMITLRGNTFGEWTSSALSGTWEFDA